MSGAECLHFWVSANSWVRVSAIAGPPGRPNCTVAPYIISITMDFFSTSKNVYLFACVDQIVRRSIEVDWSLQKCGS